MGLDGLIILAPNFPTLFYCNIERIENNDDTPKNILIGLIKLLKEEKDLYLSQWSFNTKRDVI